MHKPNGILIAIHDEILSLLKYNAGDPTVRHRASIREMSRMPKNLDKFSGE